jgi:hypothetical protein
LSAGNTTAPVASIMRASKPGSLLLMTGLVSRMARRSRRYSARAALQAQRELQATSLRTTAGPAADPGLSSVPSRAASATGLVSPARRRSPGVRPLSGRCPRCECADGAEKSVLTAH